MSILVRLLGAFFMLAPALLLAGCASNLLEYHDSAASQAFYGQDRALVNKVSPTAALAALPPAAGSVLEVDEERFDNGIAQRIVLGGRHHGEGDNAIDISVQVQPRGDAQRNHLIPLSKPSDVDIGNELQTRFPGMVMTIAPVLVQNHYGPYGIAAGHTNRGDTCIYAWQWIDDFGHANTQNPSSIAQGLFAPRQPAALRVRLCQSGVNADALGGLVNELILAGSERGGLPALGNPGLGYGNGISSNALGSAGAALAGGEFSGYSLPAKRVEPPVGVARVRRRPHRYARHVIRQQVREPAVAVAPPQYVPPAGYVPSPTGYARPTAPQMNDLPVQALGGPRATDAPRANVGDLRGGVPNPQTGGAYGSNPIQQHVLTQPSI